MNDHLLQNKHNDLSGETQYACSKFYFRVCENSLGISPLQGVFFKCESFEERSISQPFLYNYIGRFEHVDHQPIRLFFLIKFTVKSMHFYANNVYCIVDLGQNSIKMQLCNKYIFLFLKNGEYYEIKKQAYIKLMTN